MRSNFLVGWNSVFKHLDMTPGQLSATEHKKLMSALEKDLADWDVKRAAAGMANLPKIDPKEAGEVIKVLHKVFAQRKTEEIEIGALAAYCQMVGELDDELDAIKNKVRIVAKLHPTTFSVGAGGAPRVRRLTTVQGKPTGVDAFDTSRPGAGVSSSSEGLQRFTKRVKALGFTTKAMFESAKKDLGTDSPTAEQLMRWVKSS